MPKLTFEQIKALDKEMLTPMEVSGVLGCAPYNINVMAKQAPELLGFPVIMVGKMAKIPRRAFVNFIEGEIGGNGFMGTVKKEYNRLDGIYNMVKYTILTRSGGNDTDITDDIIRSTTAEVIAFFGLESPKNAEYKELIIMLQRRFCVCE